MATVELHLEGDYRFTADFGLPGVPPLLLDEPRPLGAAAGPNAARLLASAVGNCLSASLLFCLRKARMDVRGLHTTVQVESVRNERGRLRIASLSVQLRPEVAPGERARMGRCLELFEDFCVVTDSVRKGIPVAVRVEAT